MSIVKVNYLIKEASELVKLLKPEQIPAYFKKKEEILSKKRMGNILEQLEQDLTELTEYLLLELVT
jgi:hypothetical protein